MVAEFGFGFKPSFFEEDKKFKNVTAITIAIIAKAKNSEIVGQGFDRTFFGS